MSFKIACLLSFINKFYYSIKYYYIVNNKKKYLKLLPIIEKSAKLFIKEDNE